MAKSIGKTVGLAVGGVGKKTGPRSPGCAHFVYEDEVARDGARRRSGGSERTLTRPSSMGTIR